MDCRLSPLAARVLVSEYQYYDFRAIDRPLAKKEMGSLRSISTRAAITTTSFTNHYEWGDLKANPSKLLEKYFDAFVYVANWGTHEFYIRLPQESVDYKLLKAMVPGETVRVRRTARFVIVEFGSESEWDGEDDGTGWMASLMPLRSDLLRGDLRCLYLGWLRGSEWPLWVGWLVYITLSFSLTVLLAAASYRWLESPFLRLKDRFTYIESRPV